MTDSENLGLRNSTGKKRVLQNLVISDEKVCLTSGIPDIFYCKLEIYNFCGSRIRNQQLIYAKGYLV